MPGLRHPENPLPDGMHLDRVRRLLARADVGRLLGQEPQAAAQTSLHRHRRHAEHLGGLRLRHRRDTHQVEDLALVLRQRVDRRKHADALPAGAGTSRSFSSAAAGWLSKRRARSLRSQRLCWLARANTGRTVRSSPALAAGLE